MPAARDPSLGARIFGDRREWSTGQGEWSESVREVEKSLSTRIQRVEQRVEKHSELIQDLQAHSATTETSFRNLLSTVEGFCNQATRRIERVSPVALPAWSAEPRPKRSRGWAAMAGALALSAVIVAAAVWVWPAAQPAASTKKEQAVTEPAVVSKALPNPESAALPAPGVLPAVPRSITRVDLDATDPTWVTLIDEQGNKVLLNQLLVPGAPRTFEIAKGAALRTGNAGGLVLRVNGRPSGPLGPSGQVRQIQIKGGRVLTSPQ